MKIYAVEILDIREENLDRLCLLIDIEKKYKVEKFINKKDKIRTLVGELLVRSIINKKLGIENKSIKFDKNLYGKPYLKGYPDFNFNISHSGDFVVCAIDNKHIGIDIEKVQHVEYERIAKSFFSKIEVDYIFKGNSNIQLSKFYEIWTLRESYIKCCGQGLTIPLKSFFMHIDENSDIKVIETNRTNEYIFKKFNIGLDYKISVCSLNKEIPNSITMINQNSLVNSYSK